MNEIKVGAEFVPASRMAPGELWVLYQGASLRVWTEQDAENPQYSGIYVHRLICAELWWT